MSHLDRDLLDGYFESLGKNVVEEMLALYQQQVVNYLQEIAQALNSEQEWHLSCHKMKGAAGSLGLTELHKKLSTVEKQCDDKTTALEEIKSLNSASISAFEQWLASK